VGPPGTGKSQTIANMIANCLSVGKTVLFVAEKTAALGVVYRRLREHGLGNHCIELHSNKADRRQFLGQLKAAWEHGGLTDASEWVAVNERLRLRRDELNAYVEALHRRYLNGWTPYLALGIALKASEDPAPDLSWPERDIHDAQALRDLDELAAEIGRVFASVERQPALDFVEIEEWSFGWQEQLLATVQSLQNAADLLSDSAEGYLASLSLNPKESLSQSEIQALTDLATALKKSRGRDISIVLDRECDQHSVPSPHASGKRAIMTKCGWQVTDSLPRHRASRRRDSNSRKYPGGIQHVAPAECPGDRLDHRRVIARAGTLFSWLLSARAIAAHHHSAQVFCHQYRSQHAIVHGFGA
jgi:hypothetical protein